MCDATAPTCCVSRQLHLRLQLSKKHQMVSDMKKVHAAAAVVML